ncbi:HAD family hydrolase [Gordonia alkanivorans]|uniref:HAD family hydrolase n=1 Tax=Gordonia alkanivorans TaxID=84096 RepID=UPI000FDE260A|nr:HAD family hydrolase [Gordonia alkanivorans]AZZ82290.1 HAD family hydrolase [Gordonia alkanivorans]
MRSAPRLLVTDLDNTLWDWFEAWHTSFSAMLDALVEQSGVARETLLPEIRAIHQKRGTTEYSYLLNEVPSLIEAAGSAAPLEAYDDAIHALNRARKKSTLLYPGVMETLTDLKGDGVRIVAYTESIAYWTEWRIKHTELDGVIDVLYSAPDHDVPAGVTIEDLRTLDPESYGLKYTEHQSTPIGAFKPNPDVLRSILENEDAKPNEVIYVGDSLMKDIAMAQHIGVTDVHAVYGEAQGRHDYSLLQAVTHWTQADVDREQALRSNCEITPSHTIDEFASLKELLN